MFTFTLIKQVHGCFASMSSVDVWLEKEVKSPIPPFIGMTVDFYSDYYKINEVWLYNENVRCYTEPDKTFYEKGLKAAKGLGGFYNDTPEFKELISDYVDKGWQVRKK